MAFDRWSFYWHALERGGFTGWDNPGAPYPGFWRFRYGKVGIWRPCAIWDTAIGAVMASEGAPIPSRDCVERFEECAGDANKLWGQHFCWMSPVTEDQYRHAVQHGTWWDTLRAAANEARPGVVVTDIRKAEAIGPVLGGKR